MKVFIQKVDGEFHNVNPYTAWRGFEFMGWETEFFAAHQIPELVQTGQLTRETPVVGGIPVVTGAIEALGCPMPQTSSLPPVLEPYFGRRVWEQSLGEVRYHVNNERGPLFIKPLPQDHKLFNGHVVNKFRDLILTSSIAPETQILCSEAIHLVSEYRGFVHRGEIIGLRHYHGDFRFYPDTKIADDALANFEGCPVACSMDWGVTRDGKTVLIEVNDAYALGCYGLDRLLYASMMRDRWFEMVGLPIPVL